MLLIIPYFIIVAGISFIPAIIAVAGGILAIVTEKIKKNPKIYLQQCVCVV